MSWSWIRKGMCLLGVAILVFLVVYFGFLGKGRRGAKNDYSEAIRVLEKKPESGVVALKKKLEQIEQKESDVKNEKSMRVRLMDGLFVGDEQAGAFALADAAYPSAVCFEAGATPKTYMERPDRISERETGYVFLIFGIRSIVDAGLTPEDLAEEYRDLVAELKNLPGEPKVVMAGLFPAPPSAVAERPAYGDTQIYNEKLRQLCDELQISYVDVQKKDTDAYVREDDSAFQPGFYESVSRRLAEVAGL